MSNSIVPAAATGLPSNVIPFPARRSLNADFQPDRREFENSYSTACISWQFAHLGADVMDQTLERLIKSNRNGVDCTSRMILSHADAIRFLHDATDFLIDVDNRMQASLTRVLAKLEARQ